MEILVEREKLDLENESPASLDDARAEVGKLEASFSDVIEVNRDLSRSLVSFQANKTQAMYRWFKYREGFSKPLVEYIFEHADSKEGSHVLDPFAGTAATCFVANEKGMNATAIELLPVGCHFINLRRSISNTPPLEIAGWLHEIIDDRPWKKCQERVEFSHLRITKDAFSPETDIELGLYRHWTSQLPEPQKQFCDFLSYSILEEISFTRKDGQYLRWDHRSPRSKVGGKFNKGKILTFEEGLDAKCNKILSDLTKGSDDLLTQLETARIHGDFTLVEGSNFEAMEQLDDASVDLVVTSPPYCNRYDYTRTYALELAYLGCDEDGIRQLRQALLSCTVENRAKNLEGIVNDSALKRGLSAFNDNAVIQSTIGFLEFQKKSGLLNNNGIVKMVTGYFTEMAVHIAQLADVMKPGGRVYMVNDNVRYNGLDVPVDCILSAFAEALGFKCLKIWVLPVGKGNSSQQMKLHGRSELRKCVYIWERTTD